MSEHKHGGHQHRGGHHHHHGDDFDWERMADSLELDAAVMEPLVHSIASRLDWSGVERVLDIGCGPGAIACTLARMTPDLLVLALDSSEPLLARVRARAASEGLPDRVLTVCADLDEGFEGLHEVAGTEGVDLVWASMVVHHAADLAAGVATVFDTLAPGGVAVMVEFGEPLEALPEDDPLVVSGAWLRYRSASADALRERLPHDPDSIEWVGLLSEAGFVDIDHSSMWVDHPAPLHDVGRRWLAMHLKRGLDSVSDRLDPADLAAITSLLDEVPERDDLFLRANRQVVVARRPR